MARIDHDFHSPLLIIDSRGGRFTEPIHWTFGADRRGGQVALRARGPGLDIDVAGGLGTLDLDGDSQHVLTSELAAQELQTNHGPLVVGGVWLSVVRGLEKVAWEERVFLGAPEAMQTLEALQHAAPEPWTPLSWTNALYHALKAAFPADRFTLVEPLLLEFTTENGRSGTLDLQQSWDQASVDTAALDEALEFRIQTFGELRTPSRTTREAIVVQLKNQAYIDQVNAGEGAVAEPLAGDVWMLYSVDTPSAIRPLTHSELEEMGLGMDGLRSIAVANLLDLHDRVRVAGQPGQTHLMVICGGNYEASMLLADEVWALIDPELDGDPVVAVPTRDLLLVGDTEHPEILDRMRAIVGDLPSDAYAISDGFLTRRDGSWVPFEP